MSTLTAIYENGVFRPLEPVRLPENTRVEIPIPDSLPTVSDAAVDAVYEALQFRFRSGTGDLAARHDEHQP
ncbi:MAG TPA: antitoxin family protein [Verrucomicrobiales bacterium]|nr:antitoxin family protein [Verrucomicrobiales bacterium]